MGGTVDSSAAVEVRKGEWSDEDRAKRYGSHSSHTEHGGGWRGQLLAST